MNIDNWMHMAFQGLLYKIHLFDAHLICEECNKVHCEFLQYNAVLDIYFTVYIRKKHLTGCT